MEERSIEKKIRARWGTVHKKKGKNKNENRVGKNGKEQSRNMIITKGKKNNNRKEITRVEKSVQCPCRACIPSSHISIYWLQYRYEYYAELSDLTKQTEISHPSRTPFRIISTAAWSVPGPWRNRQLRPKKTNEWIDKSTSKLIN